MVTSSSKLSWTLSIGKSVCLEGWRWQRSDIILIISGIVTIAIVAKLLVLFVIIPAWFGSTEWLSFNNDRLRHSRF